jgi:OmpA-OmpF porin, OOP family
MNGKVHVPYLKSANNSKPMSKRHLLLAIMVLSANFMFAQGQVISEEFIPNSRLEQHEQFLANETAYPAKPRNMWAVGLNVGLLNVGGDVRTRPFGGVGGINLGYGANVRKALGYATSLRLGYTGGTAYGQNWDQQAVGRNNSLTAIGYGEGTTPGEPTVPFVHNYKSNFHNANVDFLLNLNNLKFHKSNNKVSFFLAAGGGLLLYKTAYDALDASGNPYDFASVISAVNFEDRGEQRDAIEALMDGEYETPGEFNRKAWTIGDSLDPMTVRFQTSFGAGLQFRLGKRVSLDLEHRITLPFDDLLDGQRYEAGGRTFTPNNDVLHYTSLGVSIHLGGKATEPTWFVNPMDYVYSELADLKSRDLVDSDGDGILDFLDLEEDTPEGYPVDSRGRALDSDKDGCPDGEDPEPFSNPNYPIEDCVNVMPNYLSAEEVEQLIDNKLEPIAGGAGSTWFLPNILFDLNSATVRADAYDELGYVADVMKRFKTMKVEVIGHADTRASDEYNKDLSRRRAEAAIKVLSERYGIEEGRFVMKYEGRADPLFRNARSESQHTVNRRVEFKPVTGN